MMLAGWPAGAGDIILTRKYIKANKAGLFLEEACEKAWRKLGKVDIRWT
jgi:hypothetical protein